MNSNNKTTGIPVQPYTSKIRHLVMRAIQYLLLVCAILLFAGHEKTNPKIGDTYIDFYFQESASLIEIQTTSLFLGSAKADSSDIDYYLHWLVAHFYDIRNYEPAWTINFKTTDQFSFLLSMLDSANYFGFPSSYINSKYLAQLQKEFSESSKSNELTKRIELELESTREMFRILIALNKGIVSSDSTPGFRNYVKHLPTILNNAISNGKLNEIVTHIQPGFIAYKSLISSVPNFISIQNSIAKTGENNISDSLLAQSLFYAGVLPFPEFDSAMSREKSIRKFQETHHLPVNGNLNNITLSEIKNTLSQRFSLICLNLDRMRKIYSTEDNYVFVNIPEYKLHLIENNKESEIFNVIVGNEETPTPVLSSRLEYFILNPYWTVPRSISNNEMLTKIRKDSTYLKRNGYLIVDNRENPVDMSSIDWNSKNPLGGNYWIRQTNSKDNALGAVKFLFPNSHQVYLHDTPGKHLFKKEKRAFSHGCIRLQDPQKLAQIFSDRYSSSNNKTQDIKALIDKKESKVITLSKTIEIHLAYVTCVSDEKGNIVFLKDIYNLDERELNSLFTGRPSI